jgi:hypothetical protein
VDLAAEQVGDLAADRQPETGASVAPARRPVGLLERLEDDAQLLLADADAGVDDGEADDVVAPLQPGVEEVRGGGALHHQPHLALLGELHRVRDQVAQHLLQPVLVGVHGRGQVVPYRHGKPQ